jgi:hypothetical protein
MTRPDEDHREQNMRPVSAGAAPHLVKPRLGSHARIRRFSCDILALISQVEGGGSPLAVNEEPSWVLFIRKPKSAKVIVQALNAALCDVLEQSDGNRTAVDILATVVARHGIPPGASEEDVRADFLSVLDQFYAAGILTFSELETVSAAG